MCARFRAARDALFRGHPQSALDAEQREAFVGLSYAPYDRDACVEGLISPICHEEEITLAPSSGPESMPLARAGHVSCSLRGVLCTLTIYWIDVYGGGLFLPFRDTGAPHATYGGGRYLVDTVKGSDFSTFVSTGETATVTLDFNYAYNPSCAYNPHWVCPLAPPENYLPVEVNAGESRFDPLKRSE